MKIKITNDRVTIICPQGILDIVYEELKLNFEEQGIELLREVIAEEYAFPRKEVKG